MAPSQRCRAKGCCSRVDHKPRKSMVSAGLLAHLFRVCAKRFSLVYNRRIATTKGDARWTLPATSDPTTWFA